MFRWVALASAVVFVVAFAGVIVSRSSTPPNQQEQSTDHNNEYANKEGNKALWDSWFPDSLSLYTLALVVFTAVLAFGGLYQLRALERAERISAEAANAAKDAAKATRDSVKLAEDTAQRQLRAYVNVGKSQLDNFGFNQPPTITVELVNHGQTPAYKVRRKMRIFASAYPLATNPDLEPGSDESILGPSGDVNMGPSALTVALSADQTANIVAGNWAIYAIGIVKYIDAFSAERTTKFSLFYRGNGKFPGQNGIALAHAEKGNEAD